jgi:hypothetical protein
MSLICDFEVCREFYCFREETCWHGLVGFYQGPGWLVNCSCNYYSIKEAVSL